jgi:hypothetical protein
LYIKKEFYFGLITGFATFIAYISANVIVEEPGNILEYAQIYTAIGYTVMTSIATLYPIWDRKEVPRLSNYNVDSFIEVLKNPNHYQNLRNVISRELSTENALFYEAIMKLFVLHNQILLFKDKYVLNNCATLSAPKIFEKREFVSIYKQFLSTNSPNELNISSDLRQMCSEEVRKEKPSIDVLVKVNDQVLESIYNNSYFKYCNLKGNKGT